ncbi:endonuclease V [Streptacidiphilus fuscans]|uniref:Endonuclease V n=1 Tax=Streptacidiphilus fuscans TaxID=2789292 RepID=A0A931FBU1_9ACTN|nr:endonuclease V [Streptacidiphilus fuscans]MBF9067788.1 endonuclease V [Streptacidiphilus fuscans]MBF9073871.1 endonuclease V [Streptacidiphilus fuscans]
MEIRAPQAWPTTEAAALAVQAELRPQVRAVPLGSRPRTLAGLDVAYAGAHGSADDEVAAAVVVLDAETLEPIEQATAVGKAGFPYIPGLFAFRELPVLLRALEQLTVTPDVFLCDGQGLAHPRRFGLACHLGVLTGRPTLGVAKTPLLGEWSEPDAERGSTADVTDGGGVVARVVRTQTGVKPVTVSIGHLIDLDDATDVVLRAAPRYRLPETTRLADRLCRDALQGVADATGVKSA